MKDPARNTAAPGPVNGVADLPMYNLVPPLVGKIPKKRTLLLYKFRIIKDEFLSQFYFSLLRWVRLLPAKSP